MDCKSFPLTYRLSTVYNYENYCILFIENRYQSARDSGDTNIVYIISTVYEFNIFFGYIFIEVSVPIIKFNPDEAKNRWG